MSRIANAGAGYKAQCHSTDGRVIVKLNYIMEVALEGPEVDGLVHLVQLGYQSGATVEHQEEEVDCIPGRVLQGSWVNVCKVVQSRGNYITYYIQ